MSRDVRRGQYRPTMDSKESVMEDLEKERVVSLVRRGREAESWVLGSLHPARLSRSRAKHRWPVSNSMVERSASHPERSMLLAKGLTRR